MRYHSARVVLGAFLVAATAAAQAPATSSGSPSRGLGSTERVPDGDEFPLYRSSWPRPDEPQQGQGESPYTLRAMFRKNHGEFMDRRERPKSDFNFRAAAIPNGRIGGEPGSFDLYGYEFDGAAKVLVSTDGYLTIGAYYGSRHYVTSPAFGSQNNAAGIPDETLIGAGARLGFGTFLSDNLMLEVETRPGVWSDLDDTLHHEDFDFPSYALFTYRPTPNFFFKVGARYNQVYADAPWLPMLGFSWEVLDGFRIDLLAPESLEISWWTEANSFGVLFGAEVTGAEYAVHTPESINQRDDARVQEVVSYLGLMLRPNNNVSFLLRGGIVLAGDYDLTTGAAGFDRAEGALDQAVFADFSFGFSF